MSHSNFKPEAILEHCQDVWRDNTLTLEDLYYEGPVGSRDDTLFMNLKTGRVKTGCFNGSLGEFETRMEEVYTTALGWVHNDTSDKNRYEEILRTYREAVVRFREALAARQVAVPQ